ncbi:MAG: hypothetical protein ACR2HF_11550 [Methylococcaceae bacterium]
MFKKPMMLLAAALTLGLASSVSLAGGFSFALIGDQEYDAAQITKFPNLRDDINSDLSIRFVVDDGDIKGGSTPCTDDVYTARFSDFNAFAMPFIYVPGDNEWTDCHRPKAGGYDPLERLNHLRSVFFTDNMSLGMKKMPLARQSKDFPENVTWASGGVTFIGLNIPGSNNGLTATTNNTYDAAMQADYDKRNAANITYLKAAFASAKKTNKLGLMVIIQANPWDHIPSTELTGFQEFLTTLESETRAFGKPVVLVHGDSHYFRVDKPLPNAPFDVKLDFQPFAWESSEPRLENFTRVETFGTVNLHWLKVTVDPADPSVFTFRQRIVEKNKVAAAQ